MLHVIKWLYLIALIVWVGEVVFFSFVGAPSLFRVFPPAEAGRAIGAVFPTYYGVGYACGGILLVGSLVFMRRSASGVWWAVNSLLSAVMLAATLYAGAVILPRATALRPQIFRTEAPQEVKDEFRRLHGLAVTLNSAVLVCGLAVSGITAASLRP
jgi:hypothetical protein